MFILETPSPLALQARDLRYEASAVQQQARRATNFGQKELAIRLMREAEDLRQEATRLEQEEEARLMEERWAKENGDGPGQYRKAKSPGTSTYEPKSQFQIIADTHLRLAPYMTPVHPEKPDGARCGVM